MLSHRRPPVSSLVRDSRGYPYSIAFISQLGLTFLSAIHLLLFSIYSSLIYAEHCLKHRDDTKMNKIQSLTSKSSQSTGRVDTILTNHNIKYEMSFYEAPAGENIS